MHLPWTQSGRRRDLARNDEPERDPAAKKSDHGSGLCTRAGKLRGDFAEQLPVLQPSDSLGLGCSDRFDDDFETPSVNQHPVVSIDQIHIDLGSLTPACLAQLAQRPWSANDSEAGLEPDLRAPPIFQRPSAADRRFESHS